MDRWFGHMPVGGNALQRTCAGHTFGGCDFSGGTPSSSDRNVADDEIVDLCQLVAGGWNGWHLSLGRAGWVRFKCSTSLRINIDQRGRFQRFDVALSGTGGVSHLAFYFRFVDRFCPHGLERLDQFVGDVGAVGRDRFPVLQASPIQYRVDLVCDLDVARFRVGTVAPFAGRTIFVPCQLGAMFSFRTIDFELGFFPVSQSIVGFDRPVFDGCQRLGMQVLVF